LIAMSRYMNF